MAYDTSFLIKDFTTLGVLLFIFILFYAKFKKISMGDAFKEIKENINNVLGLNEEEEKPWEKKRF